MQFSCQPIIAGLHGKTDPPAGRNLVDHHQLTQAIGMVPAPRSGGDLLRSNGHYHNGMIDGFPVSP